MKTIKLNILKKNIKYFACETVDGKKARLVINEHSKNLELGEHLLIVKDLSVYTKFGADYIYELSNKQDTGSNLITLKAATKYNYFLADECRKLGGTWDRESKCWMFSDLVQDEVERLDKMFSSDEIIFTLVASDKCLCSIDEVFLFCGYPIFFYNTEYQKVSLSKEVVMLSGDIYTFTDNRHEYITAHEYTTFKIKAPSKLVDRFINAEVKSGHWKSIECLDTYVYQS